MILDNVNRPVRPPFFLDQLAARWVARWNEKHPWRPAQPMVADDEALVPVVATTQKSEPKAAPMEIELVLSFTQAAHIANATHLTIPYRKSSGEVAFAIPPSVQERSIAPKAIHPTPGMPIQMPVLLTSRKMNAVKYYRLNATIVEADHRDKKFDHGRANERCARNCGRKPRSKRREVFVCELASTVSVRAVRKAFAPLAICYA